MRFSVGTQLAAVTLSVLSLVTTVLVIGLASQERERAIAEKIAASSMVTDLFAASVSAAVVFGDDDGVRAVLGNLRTTEDVIGGAVFPPTSEKPVGSFGSPLTPHPSGVDRNEAVLIVSRDIRDNDGHIIGRSSVAFSLERENATQAASRRNLALGGLVVMLLTAGLLIFATRLGVVRPLMRLVDAAKEIEEGHLTNRASEWGNTEISSLARAFNSMGDAVAERERLLKAELQVAADLQLSILPNDVNVEGVEMSAMMKPATEVGGDYYDIIPTADGCWIGIGDVSGHGLGAGVIMLMIQSAVAALVAVNPDLSPVDIECVVNRVLYENIRQRMGRRDHATLSLLHYTDDGRVRFAGAHEDILVYRAATGRVDTFETPGTWVGARNDVSATTTESLLHLSEGDVMVLYTDGITEAMRNGVQLGFDRLLEVVAASAPGSADEVRDAIVAMVAEWTANPADDVSVVVLKQTSAVRTERRSGTDVIQTRHAS